MNTYKVARIAGPGKVELEEWEKPVLRDDEVLVKVLACAICTSDQGVFRGERESSYPVYAGHEISAVVQEVGPAVVSGVKPGDHVAVSRINRCEQCTNCRKYSDNRCLNSRKLHRPGRPAGPGGFAELMAVPGYQVFKFPQEIDRITASLTEPVACCISSVDKANVQPGDDVLVVGAGVMGLIHINLLTLKGARVLVSEVASERRRLAKDFGADVVLDPAGGTLAEQIGQATGGKGVEAIFVTGGPPGLVPGLMATCATGATIVIYTSYHGEKGSKTEVDLNRIHYNEIKLVGTISPRKYDFQRAVALVANGRIRVSQLVERVFPFSRIQDAFEYATRPGSYRVIVHME